MTPNATSAATADWDRTTRSFTRPPQDSGSLHAFVFTRDAPLAVVPIGGRSDRRPDYGITSQGSDEEQQTIVAMLGGRPHDDLTESVGDFIEQVASYLAHYGEVVFEICRRGNELRLDATPPGSMHFLPFVAFEWIPRDAVAEEGAQRLIRVRRDKLWRVRLPRELGGPRRHRRMLKRLTRNETVMQAFRHGLPPTAYDLNAATRAELASLIGAMRRWGIIVTFLGGSVQTTSYLTVGGEIAHKRAQAILREHILEELNSLLRRLGLSPLRIVGLPDSRQIAQALAELRLGEIDFKRAIDLTSW